MAEYIEKEKIINKCKEHRNFYISAWGSFKSMPADDKKVCDAYATCWSDVVNEPAADVQPVKHGKWIDCTFYDPCERNCEQDFEFKCSNCGHKIYNKPNDNNLFCGHCSAKMDGGAENGNAEG